MAKIYLSSTYSDLKACREAVYHALRHMQYDVIAMEDYVATDERPLDKCLADVADCDLYIGLFAWRYGYIPQEGNPEHKSITEFEYRKAIEVGKSRLIFLLDEKALWPPMDMDSHIGEGDGGKYITALRQELKQKETVSFFHTAEELASFASQAVSNWAIRQITGKGPSQHDARRLRYLEQVYKRYSSVTLPIGPAEGFSLHAIFQPLSLRRDPLAAGDLERTQRRHLLGEQDGEEDGDVRAHVASKGKDTRGGMKPSPQPVVAENGEDALTKSPQGRLVILGGPGTGKTTTLKYLVSCRAKRALSDPNTPVPIFLSLADLSRSGKGLQSYLDDVVEEMGVERSYADALWKEMERGHAFVALDSLDEVDPGQRTRMIKLVNSRASEPGNIWLVGSRFTEYKGGQFKHGQFAEWELLPMSPQRRQDLAARLFPELRRLLSPVSMSSSSPSTFVSLLENHSHAAAWGENPLLFSLAAVVFVKTGGLPPSRATLYRDVIEAVLAMREQDTLRRKHLLRVLTGLALWLHQTKGRTFTSDDLFTFLEDIQQRSWGEAETIAEQIITSGILEVVARDTYGFRHQTFQEYLAATELARRLTSQDPRTREEAWKLAWSKRTYSRWTEVLRLMGGVLAQLPGKKGRSEALHWIHELIEQRSTQEGDPGDLGLALALKSLVEVTEIAEWDTVEVAELEKHVVSVWIRELLDAARSQRGTRVERFQSLVKDVVHLRECEREAVVGRWLKALKDPDTNVR